MSSSALSYSYIILLNIIWGTSYAITGKAMLVLPPLILYGVRFLIIGLTLLLFCHHLDFKEWKYFLAIATTQALCFALIAISLAHIDSSISAIMLKLDVPITLLFSFIFFKEPVTRYAIAGIALCFAAVVVLNYPLRFYNLTYIILLMVASCCSSTANLMIKKVKLTTHLELTAIVSLMMALELLLFGWLMGESFGNFVAAINLNTTCLLLYLVIFPSFLGYYLFYKVLRSLPSVNVIPFGFLNLSVAVISGYLLLDERISWNKILGILLLINGILLSQYQKPAKLQNTKLKMLGHGPKTPTPQP